MGFNCEKSKVEVLIITKIPVTEKQPIRMRLQTYGTAYIIYFSRCTSTRPQKILQ